MNVHDIEGSIFLKFGLLSVSQQKCFVALAKCLYLITYFQLLGILLKSAALALEDNSNGFICTLYKIATVSDLLDFEGNSKLTLVVLSLIMGFCYILFVDAIFILYCLKKKKSVPDMVLNFWNFECYIHPLVLFFPIHNICIQGIYQFHSGNFAVGGSSGYDIAIVTFLYICFVTNFAFAYIVVALLRPIIKTKDPFASKNQFLQVDDIIKKFLIPVFWLVGKFSPNFYNIIIFYNAIDMLGTSFMLFYYLPYYRIDILILTAGFYSSLCLYSINTILAFFFKDSRFKTGMDFSVIVTLILVPITVKVYCRLMTVLLDFIYNSIEIKNHYFSVHKKYIWSYYRKNYQKPHEKSRKLDMTYFHYARKIANISEHDPSLKENMNDEEMAYHFQKVGITYILTKAKEIHPKSLTMKISLASHLIKYQEAYLQAYQLIEEVLKKAPSFSVKISAYMIKYKLNEVLKTKFLATETKRLNLTNYTNMMSFIDELRSRISKQLNYQISFWKNFLQQEPDLHFLFQKSEKTLIHREMIWQFWNSNQEVLKQKFKLPYVLFSTYLSLGNSQFEQAKAMLETYNKVGTQAKGSFGLDDLTDSTIYAADACSITVNGSRDKLGTIANASRSFEKIFGVPGSSSVGKTMNIILPQFYRSKHDRLLHEYYETGKAKIMDRTISVPALGANGYIIPCWMHVKLIPDLKGGIRFGAILKQRKNDERVVLVKEDGTFDGYTQCFAQDINPNIPCILEVCPDFKELNEQINRFARKQINEAVQKERDMRSYVISKEKELLKNRSVYAHSESKQDSLHTDRTERNLIDGRSEDSSGMKHPLENPLIINLSENSSACDDKDLLQRCKTGEKFKFYPNRPMTLQNQREIMQHKIPAYIEYLVKIEISIVKDQFIKILTLKMLTDTADKVNKQGSSSPKTDILTPKLLEQPVQDTLKPLRKSPSESSLKTATFASFSSLTKKIDHLSEDFDEIPENINNGDISTNVISHILRTAYEKLEASLPEAGSENEENDILIIPEQLVKTEKAPQRATQIFQSSVSYQSQNSDPIKIQEHLKHDLAIFDTLNELIYKRYLPNREVGIIEQLWGDLKKRMKLWILSPYNSTNKSVKSFNNTKLTEVMDQALSRQTPTTSMKVLMGSFVLVMSYFLVSLVVFNTNILISIDNATNMVNGARSTYVMATYAVLAGNYMLDMMTINQGIVSYTGDFSQDTAYTQKYLKENLMYFQDAQRELFQAIYGLQDDQINLYFEKNIAIVGSNTSDATVIQHDDYLHASKRLIDYGIEAFVNSKISAPSRNYTNKFAYLFLNNIKDDFVEETINISHRLLNKVLGLMDTVLTNNSIVFATIICTIIFFIVVAIRTMHAYAHESYKFMNIFMKFPYEQATAIEYTLNKLNEIITNYHDMKFFKELYIMDIERKTILKKKTPQANRKANMRSHYLDIQKLYIRFLPFILVLIAICATFYSSSVGIISQGKQISTRAVTSSGTLFGQSSFTTILTSYFYHQGRATVRGMPGKVALQGAIQDLSNTNQLVNCFRDIDGSLGELERSVLFNFSCNSFLNYGSVLIDPELYYSTCLSILDHNTYASVSLVNIFQTMATKTTQLVDYWEQSGENLTTLGTIFSSAEQVFPSMIIVSRGMLFILIDNIYLNFNQSMSHAVKIGILFILLALISDIFIGMVTGRKVIHKILRKEMERKRVLKLVPPELIVSNTFLRTYVIQNSSSDLNLNFMM